MSALTITVKTLLASPGVTALAGQRIYPVLPDPDADYPNVVVHLIHSDEELLVGGASQWPEARISIDCRGRGIFAVKDADLLAEAVIDWLRDRHLYQIDGCEVTFRKEGSDETDSSEDVAERLNVTARRIVDFYLRFRTLP